MTGHRAREQAPAARRVALRVQREEGQHVQWVPGARAALNRDPTWVPWDCGVAWELLACEGFATEAEAALAVANPAYDFDF